MINDRPEFFIITHGDLGSALLDAAEKIIGKQDNVHIYSNKEESLTFLSEKIHKNLANIRTNNIIFFIDLMGGSCWNLANMIRKKYVNIKIITGVNLPMLISCFNNFEQMSFPDLIQKLIKDGNRGIYSVTE